MQSDLPQIKAENVAQRLTQKVAEQAGQIASLELLAEALRDQRNELQARVNELEQAAA